jgi:Na+/H+-dicarboxylate symporter
VVPAVVLFSISVGIALIGIKDKQHLIHDLTILSKALMKVAQFVVYLTPIGVFAISASAAGTMTLEELGRLQAYFADFILSAILLTFWILPMLAMCVTPFKYKDIIGYWERDLKKENQDGPSSVMYSIGLSKILFRVYL